MKDKIKETTKLLAKGMISIKEADKILLGLFNVSNNAVAVCGELGFKCRFRKGEYCYSIDECSLKMEQTDC